MQHPQTPGQSTSTKKQGPAASSSRGNPIQSGAGAVVIHPGRKIVASGESFEVIKHNPKEGKSPHQSSHLVSVHGEYISPIKRIIAGNESDVSMTTYKKSAKIGIGNLVPCSEDLLEERADERIPHFSGGKKSVIGGVGAAAISTNIT